MTQNPVCHRSARCSERGTKSCPTCAGQTTTAPRVTLAEDAVMAMAMSVSFATIFIALALLLA